MASLAELYNPPPTMSTPLPPQQVVAPPMSTPLPPQQVPNPTLSLEQYSPANVVQGLTNQLGYAPNGTPIQAVQGINGAFQMPTLPGATQTTMGALDTLLDGGNSYVANARRRGAETAARRGLMNSTIASGASERAAIESSMPILGEIMGLTRQREGQDFSANQAARAAALGLTTQDRQNQFDAAQNRINQALGLTDSREARALNQQQFEQTQTFNREQLREQAVLDDWLQTNSFNRQFNANLALLPINNTFELLQNIMGYATENPQVWTPDIVSGTSNFFTNSMFDVLNRYFPGTFTQSAGGG